MKLPIIIFTGGKNGLAKELKKILEARNYDYLNFTKKNYDLSNLNTLNKIHRKIDKIKNRQIIFINIANTLGEINFIGKLKKKKIVESININLISPIILLNFILRFKVLALINITSGAGFTINKKLSLYSITKLATHRLFEFIKKENSNIIVKNIDPGIFQSNMHNLLKEKKIIDKKRTAKTTFKVANLIFNRIKKIIIKI